MPHLWLDGHRSLNDQLGTGFSLLRFNRDTETEAFEHAAKSAKTPLDVVDVASEPGRDLYARDVALIRPDMVVAWRGDRLPEDCVALVARVTGR